ncbi:hypothetical protein ANCCAN_30115 [Ancylostoma caninum]|uniref:Uncharacterized protein n=1 Tax=Ancylostoma caninum TaxID=29170 RepID=A0A368EZT5_ANCCA|nr:hypothetical protein ANCCAN_30115 [Ancylostoma caninum]
MNWSNVDLCSRAKSEQLARSRAGEESSDDDVADSDEEQPDRAAEVENELIRQMKELRMDINPEQVAICVSEMIAAMNIHPAPHERVRMSSPPRQPVFRFCYRNATVAYCLLKRKLSKVLVKISPSSICRGRVKGRVVETRCWTLNLLTKATTPKKKL